MNSGKKITKSETTGNEVNLKVKGKKEYGCRCYL
jgi:hypothetical protein